MIRLTCTNCKAVLTIDDAFAGGVCRCLHCGTIQTVPAHLKGATVGSGVGATAPKPLYQTKGKGPAGAGTGLEDFADAVTSSGLRDRAANAGASRDQIQAEAPPRTPSKGIIILLTLGAVIIICLVGVIVYLVKNKPQVGPGGGPGGTGVVQGGGAIVKPGSKPAFCGISLDEPSVIYILDRGDSSRSCLPHLKMAALKSAGSLGPDRKFQVMFWDNGSDFASPSSLAYATADNIDKSRVAIDDVFAIGSSDVKSPLHKAIAQSPAVIILATGKGWMLDDNFTKDVLKARGKSSVKIHTVSIGTGAGSPPLKKLAEATGGEYRELTERDLSAFVQPQP